MAFDTEHIDEMLATELDAAATAPVYRTVPSTAPARWVRFRLVAEVDVYHLRGQAWGEFLYDITGRDKAPSAAAVKTELAAIKARIQDAAPAVTGGRVVFLRREGRREDDPVLNGVQYQHVIDTYRLRVVPT